MLVYCLTISHLAFADVHVIQIEEDIDEKRQGLEKQHSDTKSPMVVSAAAPVVAFLSMMKVDGESSTSAVT